MRYSCDKCEYAASKASHLKQHNKIKHEGVTYPCDNCENAATRVSDLKWHIESKHKGVRYPCDNVITLQLQQGV